MRRFQHVRIILIIGLRGSCWCAAPQLRLLPRASLQELVKEGRHMSALHLQLGTAMKNRVMRSSSLCVQWPQQRTWLKGAGQSRKLVSSMYGGTHKPYSRSRRARNTNYSILARNQARRHWVYSGHYPGSFVTPNNAQNAETKRWSGAVPIPQLALLALTTSAYSSLGVSRESIPRPQLLKALV